MIRESNTVVETPFGTFGVDIFETKVIQHGDDLGPSFYAETADGTFTVNGVEYKGSVYFRRWRADGSLFIDAQHAYRWDANQRIVHLTDSARRKLEAALMPTVEAIAKDSSRITAKRIASLQSAIGYALQSADREIDKANEAAAEIRALGGNAEDTPKFRPFA